MIDWLINRAKRTPYFHLDGYMERYWLVPYNQVIERKVPMAHGDLRAARYEAVFTDGTGPVIWRRPFTRLLQKTGIAARVHHILRSDRGRAPHDHPWPYLTIILRGGYWEHVYDEEGFWRDVHWRGPGSVLFRPAKSLHKLEVQPGQTAWTLFITGRKQQTWGFKPPGAPKVPYYDYKEEA